MTKYRNNHYVPDWYQQRFIPKEARERKYYYLDLSPECLSKDGHRFVRNSIKRWGPKRCFCEDDLYTTQYGDWVSTNIEQNFFGPLDASARPALDYFANFAHPSSDGEAFRTLLRYMSLQKLRTPKGLRFLATLMHAVDNNGVLLALQKLEQMFCAIWTEGVWAIADASLSPTKFIISDHPVTVYNKACFPQSRQYRGGGDPDIRLSGTHTIFPLSLDKILILTNLSWVRHPYGNPVRPRPNPTLFREAVMNFTGIQTGRELSEREVMQINYIIKARAYRYVASGKKAWLFPERTLGVPPWHSFGDDYLLMPDPRSVVFTREIVFGFEGGGGTAFDPYGRRPWQEQYNTNAHHEGEWETFLAFQGEYARLFGPRRRGQCFEGGRITRKIDSDDFHRYHLRLEHSHRKHRYKAKAQRRRGGRP